MTAPIVYIGDERERAEPMRRSARAGRPVHLWLPAEHRVPPWANAIRGDPAEPATYAPMRDQAAVAVVDLADPGRAVSVARTIRRSLPNAPVLLIDRQRGRRRGSVRAGITWIDEGELLAAAVDVVLARAASRRRAEQLAEALDGADRCAFLVQHDPDPDAIASSMALRATLDLPPERSPIVTCGSVTRPENQRLLAEVGERVRHVGEPELRRLRPLVLVDVQPPYFGASLDEVAAVIDHHPITAPYRVAYRDVRTGMGASATMAAEYLLAARGDQALTTALATALLYGIVTDTRSLTRAASDADLRMFATLFPLADHEALRRIQHPSYAPMATRLFGRALQRAEVRDGLAYLHLGRLPRDQEHIVAQLAEFCLGMAGARISVVSGVFGGRLVMSARALESRAVLGERLAAAFGPYGSAGGHPLMAKAVVPLARWREAHPFGGERQLERTVRETLESTLVTGRRRSPRTPRRR